MCQTEKKPGTKFVRLTFANAREQILKSIGMKEAMMEQESTEIMEEDPPSEPYEPLEQEQGVKVTMSNNNLVMSNDPLMGVRVFCAICDHDVLLSGLQSHLRSHEVSLGQYTRVFGDPRKEIVAPVHHSCAICSQTLLLNTWDISRHLRRHNISFTKYARKHMRRGEGILQANHKVATHKSTASKTKRVSFAESICSVKFYNTSESPEKVKNSVQTITFDEEGEVEICTAVKIQCKVCFKTFKMNKQLATHMRRH